MALRTAHNPYGGLTGLTDRLIGDAYPIVKEVHDKLALIQTVAVALNDTNIGAPFLMQRAVIGDGATGLAGATTLIDFPNLDMTLSGILDSRVRILGNDNALYFGDSGYFTSKVTADGLSITLKADAPAAVIEAVVQWFVIYGE